MEYENVIRINTNNPHAHNNLGNSYEDRNSLEKAMAEFEAILAIDPGNAASYLNLVMLYWRHKKDSEKACFYLRRLSDLEPDEKEAISTMIEKFQTKKTEASRKC